MSNESKPLTYKQLSRIRDILYVYIQEKGVQTDVAIFNKIQYQMRQCNEWKGELK